ncbi:metal ABC transporter substrate-binding protein [Halostagnicola kamekurae]|uniref:Zinc transport system substrate-binding protein n=1 Tax=Halostagnicola kamekurae TaxID=619731 RepID=A0A1I6QTW9_9EURY|nr:metal ABC transporter substrate-binding protein [Halostagnicola kamekurae]SFS55893.1 zinc transport system substrate-binding protein [Halostagnicola kamekurae]
MNLSRRSALRVGMGSLALATGAGCLSEPEQSNASGGYAAFFPLWDWARHVSGDAMEFENAVDTGQMGHGWEPPSDLQRDIASSRVFVYLDTEQFPWASEFAAEFERNYDTITLIDCMDGLENHLLPIETETDADADPASHDFDAAAVDIARMTLFEYRTGEEVGSWHEGHWHGGVPNVPVGDEVAITAVFEDDEGRVLPLGTDEQFQIAADFAGEASDALEIDSYGDHVVLAGSETAQARVAFELVADGETVWETSEEPPTVSVVEELEETTAPENADPHVWLDPVIAQDIVETIAEGLADADPDNADTYDANAAAYREELAAVDEKLHELTDAADRTVAVFAGHDSYRYLERRYGFELRTPAGISPDEVQSSDDISELIEVVEEHDIETILYDPFETQDPGEDVPTMVDVLLEETDATDSAPLTPLEGNTEEWDEAGYGWVEQMESVNIPSLKRALGAE